jgi:hypothetical protein
MSKSKLEAPQATNSGADPEILIEKQVAALFQQTPRTIRNWRIHRGLPFFKPSSKTVLFRRSECLAWMNECRVGDGIELQ